MFDLFKRLVGKSRPVEVTLRHRDCHCHVIPGVDDGSRNLEESLAMLRLLAGAGARQIVCTPHMYPERYDNRPDALKRVFSGLLEAVNTSDLCVELELGAEHFLDDGLLDRVKSGEILAFGPERYVLFETSTGDYAPSSLMEVVYELSHRGFTPLVAHVERYHWLRGEDREELCEDLRGAGARFQVNRTVGKINMPGRGPRGEFIQWLLDRQWIDEVGSDLHRATPEGRPYAD